MPPTFGAKTTADEVVEAFRSKLEGKTIVITGPSVGGLGAETALALARGNPKQLVLAGRNEAKIKPLIDEIATANSKIDVKFVKLDLADLASVRAAADQVKASVEKIDVLINNAGIMAVQKYTKTADGIEIQFGSNHVGHFLFTNLLVGKVITAGKGARVINVSSMGYQMGKIRFDDWNFSDGKEYNPWRAYGQSKVANVLYTVALAKRLASKGVLVYSLHPGLVLGTNLQVEVPQESFADGVQVFQEETKDQSDTDTGLEVPKSNPEGAATIVAAAIATEGPTGSFWRDCNITGTTAYSKDPTIAEKLWELSEKLVGEKFGSFA